MGADRRDEDSGDSPYEPRVSAERAAELLRWHEDVLDTLSARTDEDVEYLGLQIHVPAGVFPPTPVSDVLGRVVIEQARPGMRVLDVGSGSGINSILAARQGADVVGIDVNPASVEASRANAAANGVADRTEFVLSDLFDDVDGTFDLMITDPPFRWFPARSMLARAVTDERFRMLRRFLAETPARLRPGGAVLVFYGTSGDVAHLDERSAAAGFASETIAERTVPVRGEDATYFVRRLTLPPR